MVLHQEFETKYEVRDLVDKVVHKNCFEVDIVKSMPRLYILKGWLQMVFTSCGTYLSVVELIYVMCCLC